MRALLLLTHGEWDGAATAFVRAARGLAERGHVVTLACPRDSDAARHASGTGVEAVATPPNARTPGLAWWLRRTLRDRFVDVVFVHSTGEAAAAAAGARLAGRGAVVRRVPVGAHAEPPARTARLASAGVLVAFDEDADAAAAQGWALPPTVAPPGVDVDLLEGVTPMPRTALGVPDEGTLVACWGARHATQDVIRALRALAPIARRHPELHVAVVGPAARDEALRLHASALGLGRAASFHADEERAPRIMRAADLGWVAASGDDAAFALLQCMALGVPLVTPDAPWMRRLVDHDAAVVAATDDAALGAAHVAGLLGDPARRDAMAAAARERVAARFPASVMIDGFEAALRAAGDRAAWATQ